MLFSYKISSLGDSALLVDFGNCIDEEINKYIIHLAAEININKPTGVIEAVPAYSSLAVFYNVIQLKKSNDQISAFENAKQFIENQISSLPPINSQSSTLIRIPVCYEHGCGMDMERVSKISGLTIHDVIDLHTSKPYRVYMIGFLPGFAYMGEVDNRINIPRKSNVSTVPAGSVGIAGKQTGIYPLNSPGGWNIIGRTPIRMFLPENNPPVHVKAGDTVQFYPISYDEFESN
jgi:inhibitor of KinA